MTSNYLIRPIVGADLSALKAVLDASQLFPSEMLDDMISAYLTDASANQIWLTAEISGQPSVLAYCEPERMTNGTWNLLAIAVHPAHQGRGYGAAMMRHLEKRLSEDGQRILLVETSGLPDYDRTRRFYVSNGYTQEARIRDYYQPGEDKIVFWKALGTATEG